MYCSRDHNYPSRQDEVLLQQLTKEENDDGLGFENRKKVYIWFKNPYNTSFYHLPSRWTNIYEVLKPFLQKPNLVDLKLIKLGLPIIEEIKKKYTKESGPSPFKFVMSDQDYDSISLQWLLEE